MKTYGHILSYVARTVWAILPEKMDEMLAILAHRAAGRILTNEEIQARIGDPQPPIAAKRGSIAVIPLRGVIAHRMGSMDESSGGMSAERFTAMLRAAVADESVGTIVLDVDSPGGTIPGVPEAADAVFNARETKRVVAVANSTMASAAYWIASQAHEIVAIPSALDGSIGSIGAFVVHQDLSAHLEKEGVKVTLIKAGKHKADANPFEPLSDEAKTQIQGNVDAAYGQFVKAVARGRGVTAAAVRAGYGEGRALSAPDAKAAGLIDRIATFDETIARLAGRGARAVGMRAEEDEVAIVAEGVPVVGAPVVVQRLPENDRARRFNLL
jgi:capsid assembly protease